MSSETLLVGDIALAAILIKMILSTIKQVFPSLVSKPNILKGSAILLGVFTAFALDLQLFSSSGEVATGVVLVFQKILSGFFVGATSIGVHESIKALPKKG